jgi:hypothetical protein
MQIVTAGADCAGLTVPVIAQEPADVTPTQEPQCWQWKLVEKPAGAVGCARKKEPGHVGLLCCVVDFWCLLSRGSFDDFQTRNADFLDLYGCIFLTMASVPL